MKQSKKNIPVSQKFCALGFALCYFALFFTAQIAAQISIGFVWGLKLALDGFSSADLLDGIIYTAATDLALISAVIGNLFCVLACVLFMAVRKKSFANEVGWHKMGRRGYLAADITAPTVMGFALSALCTVEIAIVVTLAEPLGEALEQYSEQTAMFTEGDATLVFITTVLAAPIAEEMIFRGLIYTRLRRAFSYVPSLLITSLLFGLAHGTLIHMLYTVPLSILLCVCYDRYRSLWAPILLHFGFNFAGSAMMYYSGIPYWFIGVCAALVVFGIIMLCTYKSSVTDETWNVAMCLPQKHRAPQYGYAQSCIYPPDTQAATEMQAEEPTSTFDMGGESNDDT